MKTFFIVIISFFTTLVWATDAQLKTKLQGLGLQQVELQDSPIQGLRTVIAQEGVFYISENGRYLLQGRLYELTDKDIVALSAQALLAKLNALQPEMIVYPAKNQQYVVTVFMDISCHYCHVLYQDIAQYNELGITLRFLAFPRAGLSSETASQMEAIWTATDPLFAFNQANQGTLPKTLKVPNLVQKHYQLGIQFGVTGTPSIITEKGEIIGGYLKPQDLLNALNSK